MSVALEPPDTTAIGTEFPITTWEELVGAEGLSRLAESLLRHIVVRVVSDQPIDPAAISAVAMALGKPPSYADAGVRAVPGHEIIGDFSARAKIDDGRPRIPAPIEALHQDFGTIASGFSSHSILHTRDVPPIRPMRWVSAGAAYASLLDDVKDRIGALRAIHAHGPDRTDGPRRPLVLSHPVTGEAVLHLPMRRDAEIEDMSDAEGDLLIAALWDAVEASPARYERVLHSNDLYVWDNIASFHDNPAFPRDKDRVIWFLTIPCESNPKGHVRN